MSKYVKNLIAGEIQDRLQGVEDAVLANVVGMDAQASFLIRKRLRENGIHMLVVKRSMAGRATADTSLGRLFDEKKGSIAVVWGAEDFVSLAKEISAISKAPEFKGFELKGGVMEGVALSPDQVLEISKWPNREEQLSMLVGQILGPGANLSAQLLGPASTLAGQVDKLVENKEGEA